MSFFFISTSFGQTKSDTEKWIEFYLDKFSHHPYLDISDSYFFQDGYLVHTDNGTTQSMTNYKEHHLNLAKVQKVDLSIDYNTAETRYIFPCLTITLYFNYSDSCEYVLDGATKATIHGFSYTGFHSMYFYDVDVLRDNIPQRLKKAIEYLVSLEGTSLVKDIF
jgi:hypothetical protein